VAFDLKDSEQYELRALETRFLVQFTKCAVRRPLSRINVSARQFPYRPLAVSYEHHTFRMTREHDADTCILDANVAFMHREQPLTAFVFDWVLKWSEHVIRLGCA
jgi:hypothetical protein